MKFKEPSAKVKVILKNNSLGLWIIVTAWLIFFSPILAGKVYFLDDLKIIFYPLEHVYAQFQSAATLPQWSNVFGFGQPLMGWGQLGFFTPIHVLLRFLGFDALNLLQLSIGIYFFLGLVGFYSLLRIRRFSQIIAAMGASMFVFTGFTIGHLNHVNFYTSTLLLPYLLLCAQYLIVKPNINRSIILTLIAAAVALSGQPQVVLYTFIIAFIISLGYFFEAYPEIFDKKKWTEKRIWTKPLKVTGLTVLAGGLAISLASLSILPLYEFLPQTERGGTIPVEELLDFSYPPYHAITLIAPYFFGDHDSYWGAKGFQELAAFTGIIPLFLAGAALVSWKKYKIERATGIILVLIGGLMALGKYSFVYKYLVEQHIITSLNIPGRFVFFFLIGILLLTVCGLSDAEELHTKSKTKRIAFIVAGFATLALLFTPFFFYIQYTKRAWEQLNYLLQHASDQLLPTIIGIIAIILFSLFSWHKKIAPFIPYVFSFIVIGTLLTFSYGYNPRTTRDLARSESSITDYFAQYDKDHALPGRLYSHPVLIRDIPDQSIRRTDPISPNFTVHQPIQADYDNLSCLDIAFKIENERLGDIQITLSNTINSEPIRAITLPVSDIRSSAPQRVCFDPITDSAHKIYVVSFTSKYSSGVTLYYGASENQELQGYFVRKTNPTPDQLLQSRKNIRVQADAYYKNTVNTETALLSRHLQAVYGLSSARWISALSIRPYREFIESFFANDGEVIDGDGLHAIQRNKQAVDMVGITHLMQSLPVGSIDGMERAGFRFVEELPNGSEAIRLYENPDAYPKAFMVPNGIFVAAADDTRFQMKNPEVDYRQTVFLSGPTPPTSLPAATDTSFNATAEITRYDSTRVDVNVVTEQDAFLVVSDSTTDQWVTYIDDAPAPHYVAYSMFKTALVPKGAHTISFRYESKAIRTGEILSTTSLLIIILLLVVPRFIKKSV